MRRFRKMVTAILVWATAASSLIGSTPHIVCRCPDGTVKQFCSGQASPESSCCCNGHCCSSPSDGGGGCCKVGSPGGQEEQKAPCCDQTGSPDTPSKSVVGRASEEKAGQAD